MHFFIAYLEKNNVDIGINIADDLEQLRNNLNKFKNSKVKKFAAYFSS